jgi:hypothetical protein
MAQRKPEGRLCRALVGSLFLALASCGGNQSFEKSLDAMWQWDGGVEASQVQTAIADAQAVVTVPAAVGVTGRGLVGRTLPDGKLWTYEGAVDVLPSLVGDLVLFTGEGVLTALEVKTGIKKYAVKVNERRLEGAGYDGKYSILLLVDSDDAREDQILVLGPRGEHVYSATAKARLGTPAAVGGVGLVPYSGQYIGALDLATGALLGRILLRDGLHAVEARPDGLVLYGAGATPLNRAITSSPDSRSLKLKPRDLPGEPSWPIDGSKPRPPRSLPVGLHAYAEPKKQSLRFSSNSYVATYYEVVVGFEHETNKLLWATHLPRGVTGGAAGPHGPILCLENGAIVRVSQRTGHHMPYGSLEAKLKACVVSSPADDIPRGKRPGVLEQIEETIIATGPDMVAIQKVLLEDLGTNKSAKATGSLLDIAQNPLVSTDLSKEAARLLRGRRKGGEVMIAALRASAPRPSEQTQTPKDPPAAEANEPAQTTGSPTVSETPLERAARQREKLRPPPVGALAKALTRMKTPGAAAALAPYLEDPSLDASALRSIMEALTAIGTGAPEERTPVSTFLYQYKNTGGEPALIDALVLAAHFLFKFGDDAANEKLLKDLGQSLTHPALAEELRKSPPKKEPAPEDNGAEKNVSERNDTEKK